MANEQIKRLDMKTEQAARVRSALRKAVNAQPADALMFSGGIDSSSLAALDPTTPAFTAVLEGQGQDLKFAQKVVERLGVPWYGIELSVDEAIANLKELVTLTRSYDPAMLNDIPLYAAMKHAASLGARRIRTGDFADVLFKGYSSLYDTDLPSYLDSLLPHLTLASSRVGRAMGLSMSYPYLNPEVIDVAKSLSHEENVVKIDTDIPGDFAESVGKRGRRKKEAQQTWGKMVLRQAMLGILPTDVVFRVKADLQFGSGMYKLEESVANLVTDQEIAEYEQQGLSFWNRMHVGIYKLYREAGLTPSQVTDKTKEYACKSCTGAIEIGRHHCITCGAYPADRKPRRKIAPK